MNFSFKLLAAENQPWDILDCSSPCQGSICCNSLARTLRRYRYCCEVAAADPNPSPGVGDQGEDALSRGAAAVHPHAGVYLGQQAGSSRQDRGVGARKENDGEISFGREDAVEEGEN